MKTNISSALSNFLTGVIQGSNGAEFLVWDLYTITLASGYVLRLTNAPANITYNGHTYSADGPYVNRSQVKQSVGLSVDQIDVTLTSPPWSQIGSNPVLAAITQGQLDGAAVTVYRLFQQEWGDMSLGAVIWFVGEVAEISELDRVHAKFTVKDKKELLNAPLPRNRYQPGCRHTLFDAGCTLLAANFAVSGAVNGTSNLVTIQTNLTQPGPTPAPVLNPSAIQDFQVTTGVTGFNLPPVIYYVQITIVGANGESLPSNEVAHGNNGVIPPVPVSGAHYLQVTWMGTPPSGAVGWNLYVGTAPGNEQLQYSMIPFTGLNTWTETGDGLIQGQPPPLIPAGGYFGQGTITFLSGQNAGLSRYVSEYGVLGTGIFQVLPGFPYPPQSGDLFTALPGCDKTVPACLAKFFQPGGHAGDGVGNLIHFGGFPFIPQPTQGI